MYTRLPIEKEYIRKGEERYAAEIEFSKRLFNKWQEESATYQYKSWMNETSRHSNPLGS
jgi:hypothetical protein